MQTVKTFLGEKSDIESIVLIEKGVSLGMFSVEEANQRYGDYHYVETHSNSGNSAIISIEKI